MFVDGKTSAGNKPLADGIEGAGPLPQKPKGPHACTRVGQEQSNVGKPLAHVIEQVGSAVEVFNLGQCMHSC